MDTSEIDQQRLRNVLGNFCTGVTVVASVDDGEPVGMACQSFASLSLSPPLVLFCPSRASRSWARIARSGHFCVNVLAADQQDVSAVFGRPGESKFSGLDWSHSPNGAPVLDGVLTWVDCLVETVHSAGDHHVVVGRVTELGPARQARPLLFYRGDYTATGPDSGGTPDDPAVREALDTLLGWSRQGTWM